MSLIHLLRNASNEIRHLRHANEILSAKAEVIDVFRAALLGPPRGGGMSPDVVFEMERAIRDLETEAKGPSAIKDD